MVTKNITIPTGGTSDIRLFALSGKQVSNGYNRIVWFNNNCFVELNDMQINRNSVVLSPTKAYRKGLQYNDTYDQYVLKNDHKVKIIKQNRKVVNNDFRPGLWYIDVRYLKSDRFGNVVS